jgi:hypothetical protein
MNGIVKGISEIGLGKYGLTYLPVPRVSDLHWMEDTAKVIPVSVMESFEVAGVEMVAIKMKMPKPDQFTITLRCTHTGFIFRPMPGLEQMKDWKRVTAEESHDFLDRIMTDMLKVKDAGHFQNLIAKWREAGWRL